jgi:hypothetical protein
VATIFLFFFETGPRHVAPGWLEALYVAQAGLELSILLPQTPKCWDYRRTWQVATVHVLISITKLVGSTLGQLHRRFHWSALPPSSHGLLIILSALKSPPQEGLSHASGKFHRARAWDEGA